MRALILFVVLLTSFQDGSNRARVVDALDFADPGDTDAWLDTLHPKPGDSAAVSQRKEAAARESFKWCNDFRRRDKYGDQDGNAACFNVEKCAASAPASGDAKYALLLTNTLQHEPKSHRFRPEQFWSFTAWQAHGVDTVLFIPRCPESATLYNHSSKGMMCQFPKGSPERIKLTSWQHWTDVYKDAEEAPPEHCDGCHEDFKEYFPLTEDEIAFLAKHNVKVIEVPWLVPPGTSPFAGRCAPMDLVRLHSLSMNEYASVVYFDMDVVIVGDIMPMFKCAATGEFIMSEGSGAPLNLGFIALKPNPVLLEMAMWFAKNANFTRLKKPLARWEGGWAGGTAWPTKTAWPGFECGQGFLWTLLYGSGFGPIRATSHLVREAHLKFPGALPKPPRMVDRCIWNYQREDPRPQWRKCSVNFDCSQIIGLHKGYDDKYFEKHPDLKGERGLTMCEKPTHRMMLSTMEGRNN